MTIKSGLGHSQQRREFIPMITVSGAEPHNNPRPGLTYARTPHTHTHSCAHTHTWPCAQMGCCKFHNTIQCCMLNTYPTLDRFIDFSWFLLCLHVLLFCSFTCNACKNVCVCVSVCVSVCVCVGTGPLQKPVMAAQKWYGATDDGHYPINLLFLYTLCPLYVLFERTAGVCVCVRDGWRGGGGGGGTYHIQAHTLSCTHTHSAPVTNSLSDQRK